jgi:hypothetical protein
MSRLPSSKRPGPRSLPSRAFLPTRIVITTPDRRGRPLSLHVDIVGTVDHNTDESDIFLQLRPFPLPRTRYAAPWARPRIFSFDLRRVGVDAFNDAPLLGDDPDDAIRSASATSAFGDFVVDGIREPWALTTMVESHLDARHWAALPSFSSPIPVTKPRTRRDPYATPRVPGNPGHDQGRLERLGPNATSLYLATRSSFFTPHDA